MSFSPTEASQTMRTGAMHGTRRKPTIAARKLGEAVHSYLAKLNETDANTLQTLCKPDATVAAMHCATTRWTSMAPTVTVPGSPVPRPEYPEYHKFEFLGLCLVEEWFLEDRIKKCIETSDVLEYHLSLFIIEYLECSRMHPKLEIDAAEKQPLDPLA